MPRTITNQQLTPGTCFCVRGKVGFSRIYRQTTDDERDKDNKRRMHPIDKNYTTMSVYDAQVLAKNPQQPTLEEQYGLESCYNASRTTDYPGLNFTGINKSHMLPQVGVLVRGADPNNHPSYEPIQLEGELAKGTDVTLVMRVFAGQGNNGVSLDTVLINQSDFSYYGNASDVKNTLADYGITFRAMPPKTQAAPADPSAAPAPGMTGTVAMPAQSVPQGQPMAAPQPAAPQATANPFNSFGAAPQGFAPAATVPGAQAAPVQNQPVQFGVGPERTY